MKRLGGIFDFATKQERLEEIQGLLEQSDVWNNPTLAQELNQERSFSLGATALRETRISTNVFWRNGSLQCLF